MAVAALVAVVLLIDPRDDSYWAQLIAVAGLAAVTISLFTTGTVVAVALRRITLGEGATKVTYEAGQTIPASQRTAVLKDHAGDVKDQRGRYFAGLYTGADGRTSTSKVQVVMWTYAVLFGLLSLWVAKALGTDAGWEHQIDAGLQDEYMILLGGPFAAAIFAKATTATKAANGTLAKTSQKGQKRNPAEAVDEIVSNDAGDTDLVDTQYLLFNLLALTYFLGTFVFHLGDGFPEMPELLVGFTGASALAYAGKKATDGKEPKLRSARPKAVSRGDQLTIAGTAVLVDPPADAPDDWGPKVTIGDKEATVVDTDRRQGNDRIMVEVPEDAELGENEISVITALDVEVAGTLTVKVISGVRVLSVSPPTIAPGATEIVIRGRGFGAEEGMALLEGVGMTVREWNDRRITVSVGDATQPDPAAKLVVQDAEGAESEEYLLPVRP
jgi:hypothetical protein